MQNYGYEYADHWLHTPSPVEKCGGLWMVRAGRNAANPSYRVGPKIISYYSLHFVLKGAVHYLYEGGEQLLEQGDLFCLYPHRTYSYRIADAAEPLLHMFWFAFDGDQASVLLEQSGLNPDRPFLQRKISRTLLTILDEIAALMASGKNGEALKLTILQYRLFEALQASTTVTAAAGKQAAWLHRAQTYIEMHYAECISVEDVAAYVGVHRSHLSKTFVKEYGVSPAQYIVDLKMIKAAQMLRESAHSVTEIGLSLGFGDLYSFTRAFRNYYGTPPSHFRLGS